MESVTDRFTDTDVPKQRLHVTLDVSDSPPPEPLRRTLERLADLDDETVLIQVNDRAPQHLYPRLTERDYRYETVETDRGVLTAIWHTNPTALE